jgi:DNA replication protein DnaC
MGGGPPERHLQRADRVGKSYLACALGQKACREGHSVIYRRASRLYDELAQARADGTYFLLLRRSAVSPRRQSS